MRAESDRVFAEAGDPQGLLQELERVVEALRNHPTLRNEAKQLRQAATTNDALGRTVDLTNELEERLAPLLKLQKIVDDLDPHRLSEDEFKELWPKKPKEIIRGAVETGRLRERRILLQAKEATTNTLLAKSAFLAAMTALAVPFIDRALKRLVGFAAAMLSGVVPRPSRTRSSASLVDRPDSVGASKAIGSTKSWTRHDFPMPAHR